MILRYTAIVGPGELVIESANYNLEMSLLTLKIIKRKSLVAVPFVTLTSQHIIVTLTKGGETV